MKFIYLWFWMVAVGLFTGILAGCFFDQTFNTMSEIMLIVMLFIFGTLLGIRLFAWDKYK